MKHGIYSLLLNQTIKCFISFKNNIICAKDSLAGEFLEQEPKSPLWPQGLGNALFIVRAQQRFVD